MVQAGRHEAEPRGLAERVRRRENGAEGCCGPCRKGGWSQSFPKSHLGCPRFQRTKRCSRSAL